MIAAAQTPTQAPHDLASRRSLSENRWPHGLSLACRRHRGRSARCAGPEQEEQACRAEIDAQAFEEMASSQTSSSQITCGPMGPLPMISGSRTAMSVVDGETTGRRIRINRPDDENAICKASKASGQHKDFPQSTPRSTTHQVQRHLISARTNRAFRASAMQTRQEAVAVANFSDAKLSASSFQ
jgi:hypothetical protein